MHIDRRTFLAMLAAAPCSLARPSSSSPASSNLTVLLNEPIGTIDPRVYGQFAESIGRLIYEGIWVGPDSKIKNLNGYRLDTMQALKRVRPAVFRWPGGCFADTSHWEEGVGPDRDRPVRRNLWWRGDDPNTFGTDEFLRWCTLLQAEPYLSVNVGTGSPSEALNWLEYCNGTGDSLYPAMRKRNGHPEPYGVRLWGIGNESWGCGGLFTPAEYAEKFRQYAVYFKRMGMSSDTELVGVGHTENRWNPQFLEALGGGLPYLDHLSIHHYFRRGKSTTFSDQDYANLMLDLVPFESMIREALTAIDDVEPRRSKVPVFGNMPRKPIGLVIDEWGIWDEDAPISDGFSQKGTLRDAILAGSCLNLFHKYANRISMTNIAQVIDCLQSLILTDGAAMTLTPTYYVYEMYGAHQGGQSLRVQLSNTAEISDGKQSRPALSASASRSGDSLLITIVNQDPNDGADLRIDLRGAQAAAATATNLSGPSTRSENTLSQPETVVPQPSKVNVTAEGLIAQIPARSVQAISVKLS